MSTENLLGKQDIAERLSVSRREVDYLIAARAIPFIKIGRCVRFLAADVERFIESRRVAPRDRSSVK